MRGMSIVVACMLVGCSGEQGPPGPKGAPGAPGAEGPAGAAGSAGPVGSARANGADGGPGEPGADGGPGAPSPGGLVAKSGSRLRIQQALDTSPDGLEVAVATGLYVDTARGGEVCAPMLTGDGSRRCLPAFSYQPEVVYDNTCTSPIGLAPASATVAFIVAYEPGAVGTDRRFHVFPNGGATVDTVCTKPGGAGCNCRTVQPSERAYPTEIPATSFAQITRRLSTL